MEVSGTVSYKGSAVIHTVTDNLLVSEPDPVGSEYGFAVEGAVVDTDQIVKAKPIFQNEFPFVNGIPWNYTDVAENFRSLVEIQNLLVHDQLPGIKFTMWFMINCQESNSQWKFLARFPTRDPLLFTR